MLLVETSKTISSPRHGLSQYQAVPVVKLPREHHARPDLLQRIAGREMVEPSLATVACAARRLFCRFSAPVWERR